MADKAKGWLRKRKQVGGMTWLWCYQKLRPSDGKLVENSVPLGLVSEIGDKEHAAWMKVGSLKLVEKYISNPGNAQPTFGWLANHYVKHGLLFNKRNGRRKSKGTIYCYRHALDEFILPRWHEIVAAKIKPLAIRDWLYNLHDEGDFDWQTIAKIKMVMGQVFDHADVHDLETCRNPASKVCVPGSEDEDKEVRVLEPQQTWQIVSRLQDPERTLVVLIAATGVRISEALALQWRHVRFKDKVIRIEQAYRLSEITTTKTKSSKADVPMCEALAEFLRNWRSQSPYHRESDYVFASDKLNGKKPRTGQMVNRCYLKPAAIAAGIIQPDERFGFHSLRHSLSTWVHSTTKDLKVAQTMLRHCKPDITAGTYIHGVPEENLKAQEEFMCALTQEGISTQTARNSLMNARPVSSLVQ
jgi:integrase